MIFQQIYTAINLYKLDHKFAIWAFGSVWQTFNPFLDDIIYLKYAWNERHRDLMVLKGDENVQDSLKKMKQLYEDKKD